MRIFNTLDWIALILLVIGGLNWGLIAVLNLDIVSLVFGHMSLLSRMIYGLVGLCAVYTVYLMTQISGRIKVK